MESLQSRPLVGDERRTKRDLPVICSPHEYFDRSFQERIALNRANKAQQWIFELIAGRIDASETVYIDRAEWMLVRNNRPATGPAERRYLVVFKDKALHSLRNLDGRHVALLEEVEGAVRAFLRGEHPLRHAEFRCYFHYMPSVFQLHMHVCVAKATDAGRVQPVGLVRRNLAAKSSWYKDGLILCPAHRHQRNGSWNLTFGASTKTTGAVFNTRHICTCPTTRQT
jgi:hypothetical protein